MTPTLIKFRHIVWNELGNDVKKINCKNNTLLYAGLQIRQVSNIERLLGK